MKKELIIELNDGKKFDWFLLNRKQRRDFAKKVPGLMTKINAALAELKAEHDKNGAEF